MRVPARRSPRTVLAVLLAVLAGGFAAVLAGGFAAVLAGGLAAVLGPPAAARADYTGGNLPDWAVGPFTRQAGNPILTAQGSEFEADETYNPGVVVCDGVFRMLYRGQHGGTSQIGYATTWCTGPSSGR